MKIRKGSLEVVEIGNGYALYGETPQGDRAFLAHLGDGVDGLPSPGDADLPEAYGFALVSPDAELTECPMCAGQGMLFPGAKAAMWAALMPWPADCESILCDLCQGSGQVTVEEYEGYEQAMLALLED